MTPEQTAVTALNAAMDVYLERLLDKLDDMVYHYTFEQLEEKERETDDWFAMAASAALDEYKRIYPKRYEREMLAANRDYELEKHNRDKAAKT